MSSAQRVHRRRHKRLHKIFSYSLMRQWDCARKVVSTQQIRGSCSPESMSTTRVPPTRVFIKT